MSVTGLSAIAQSLAVRDNQSNQGNQAQSEQVQNEFQQVGQALQSGNLSQARQDLTTLASNLPSQEVIALQEALQSGNIAAALSAYAALQEALSQPSATAAKGGLGLNAVA